MTSVRVTVNSPSGTVTAFVAVPSSPVEVAEVVPALHELDDSLVAESVAATDRQHRKITCRFGCTACCYQLVPVSEVEARFLNKLVDSLPRDQSDAVRASAAAVVRDLDAEGHLPEMSRFDRLSHSDLTSLATRYFRMHAPCPFLEGETCSIYEQRPLACREYLVTSPSERCEQFGEETVERVPLPISLFSHLTRNGRIRSEPLVLALQRADRPVDLDYLLPGAVHLKRLLEDDQPRMEGDDPR